MKQTSHQQDCNGQLSECLWWKTSLCNITKTQVILSLKFSVCYLKTKGVFWVLTQWGRVAYTCQFRQCLVISGTISETNDDLFSTGPLETNSIKFESNTKIFGR